MVRWSEMTPRCPGFGPFGPVWSGSLGSGAVRPQYACFRGEPGSGFPVIRGSHGTVLGGAGHGVPAPALSWRGMLAVGFDVSTRGRSRPSRGPGAAVRLGRLSLPSGLSSESPDPSRSPAGWGRARVPPSQVALAVPCQLSQSMLHPHPSRGRVAPLPPCRSGSSPVGAGVRPRVRSAGTARTGLVSPRTPERRFPFRV